MFTDNSAGVAGQSKIVNLMPSTPQATDVAPAGISGSFIDLSNIDDVIGGAASAKALEGFPNVVGSRLADKDVTEVSRDGQSAGSVCGTTRRPFPGWVMRGSTASGRSQPAQVSLADLKEIPVPSEDALRQVLSLTGAEARLAQGIARGDSVEDIAQSLNIRMSTARTQLAAIFAKTHTRRQAKLTAMLGRLAHLCR
jgi:DNA-binding CsgD family transcriptional regulator